MIVKLADKVEFVSIIDDVVLDRTYNIIEKEIEFDENNVELVLNLTNLLLSNKIIVDKKDENQLLKAYKKIDSQNKSKDKLFDKETIVVALPNNKILWKSNDGSVELNSFRGIVQLKLETKKLTPSAKQDIMTAMQYGTLIVTEEEIPIGNVSAIDPQKVFEEDSSLQESIARFLLDQPFDEFKKFFDKNVKVEQVKYILLVEKKNNNRPQYIEFLNKLISTLGVVV